MDIKLKEALEAKNCPLIYAADADNGLEISFRGSIRDISVSLESEIPLDSLFVDLISSSTAALNELEEEYKERKAGMN